VNGVGSDYLAGDTDESTNFVGCQFSNSVDTYVYTVYTYVYTVYTYVYTVYTYVYTVDARTYYTLHQKTDVSCIGFTNLHMS